MKLTRKIYLDGLLILGDKIQKSRKCYRIIYKNNVLSILGKDNKTIRSFAGKKMENIKRNVKKYFSFYSVCGINLS